MKEIIKPGCVAVCIILMRLLLSACTRKEVPPNGQYYVDPNIGGVGHLLKSTRPVSHIPNQVVRCKSRKP